MKDHILRVRVSKTCLAETRNPPHCDSCYSQEWEDHGEELTVNALVLDGESVWGVLCDECVDRHHPDLPVRDEKDEPQATGTLRDALGRDATVTVF